MSRNSSSSLKNEPENEETGKHHWANCEKAHGNEHIYPRYEKRIELQPFDYRSQYGMESNVARMMNEGIFESSPAMQARVLKDNNNNNNNNTSLFLMESQSNKISKLTGIASNNNDPFTEYSYEFLSDLDNNNEFLEARTQSQVPSSRSESCRYTKNSVSEVDKKTIFKQDLEEPRTQDIHIINSHKQIITDKSLDRKEGASQIWKDENFLQSSFASYNPPNQQLFFRHNDENEYHASSTVSKCNQYSDYHDMRRARNINVIPRQYLSNMGEQYALNRRDISPNSETRKVQLPLDYERGQYNHHGKGNYSVRGNDNHTRIKSNRIPNNHDKLHNTRPQFHSREKTISFGRIIKSSKHNHPLTNAPGANLANINANITAHIDAQTGMLKTPGLPIKTSDLDKGPDGCNLFVFHIPNDMTNLALYQLFSTFGDVLSVRIMVDKISGRSRGFGFVSFSVLEAAVDAIRHVNGYVLGHKRLKVEQKKDKAVGKIMGYNDEEGDRFSFETGRATIHTNKPNSDTVDSVTPEEAYILAAIRDNDKKTSDRNTRSSSSLAWMTDEALLLRIRQCCVPSTSSRQLSICTSGTSHEYHSNTPRRRENNIMNTPEYKLDHLTQMLLNSSFGSSLGNDSIVEKDTN